MNKQKHFRYKKNTLLSGASLLLCVLMVLCIFSGCASQTAVISSTEKSETTPSESPTQTVEPTNSAEPTESMAPAIEKTGFSMTMLDVGQGLSLLIEADGHYMIYDGGGQSRSSYVVSYLKQHNVTKLDYLVASHYDEDHISGLIGVMNTTKVDQAITPDYLRETRVFNSFRSTLARMAIPEEHPTRGAQYNLGNATIRVLSPYTYDQSEDNGNSIIIKITYGNFSCIVTGDAEKDEEQSVLRSGEDIKANLYVVGHHGSADSSSREFVRAIDPQYAFISVGKDNSYGHPNPATLSVLMENNIQIFRTDQQGEVTVTSDGQSVSINKPPVDVSLNDSEPDSTMQKAAGESAGGNHRYVLNTNPSRKRIHDPNCHSVSTIKPENFQYSDKTLEELISEGYTPCGNCHPK